MTALSAKIHKWLALLMALQILFWFVSGLFFALFPIEQVRSEHAIARQPAAAIPFDVAADALLRLGSAGVTAERIELHHVGGRPAALMISGEARPVLYDLASTQRLSPLPMEAALRIAEADHQGDGRATRATRIETASTEYRGPLPAWRIDFDDGASRSLYVAADTGAVAARRSKLWRVYDFLWGLHIMDWRGHEDFNTPLLVVATTLGLVVVLTGIIMFPSRLGWTAWRRRRARHVVEARSNAARTDPDANAARTDPAGHRA